MLILAGQTIIQLFKNFDASYIFEVIFGYIFILIDSIVYFFVSQTFQIYIAIAQFRLFADDAFNDLINRVYIVIGVISLFLVAYALINAIINPDNISKGDKSATKMIKNFIFAIIGIAIVPTVFDYFYYFQRVILCTNTIPKLLLKDDATEIINEETGPTFATNLFQSFFYPAALKDSTESFDDLADNTIVSVVNIGVEGADSLIENYSLSEAYQQAREGKSFANTLRPFLIEGKVTYIFLISTIVGVYCAYVLANLCIDMAVRAVKLGYLQLIAPLPIMTLIIPGQKKVFDTWSKKTLSCFLEVFVRLFTIIFVVYIMKNSLKDLFTGSEFSYSICSNKLSLITVLLMRALIYCGLLIFLKQAPKFFSEATGIKSDGFKLGIADKLGEMALVGKAAKTGVNAATGAATGALGGLATGLMNRNKMNWKSAVAQGAAQGFKRGGNQFASQRKATFQSVPEYADKDQGIFGGVSIRNKVADKHKGDVKANVKERNNDTINMGKESQGMKDIKDKHFTEREIRNRKAEFENSAIAQAASDYANQRANVTGDYSDAAIAKDKANFLENYRKYTSDKDVARQIFQYNKDLELINDMDKLNTASADMRNLQSQQTASANKINAMRTNLAAKGLSINNLNDLDNEVRSQKTLLDSKDLEIQNYSQSIEASRNSLRTMVDNMSTAMKPQLQAAFDQAKTPDELQNFIDSVGKQIAAGKIKFGDISVTDFQNKLDSIKTATTKQNAAQTDRDSYEDTIQKLNELKTESNNYTTINQNITTKTAEVKAAKEEHQKAVMDAVESVYTGDGTVDINTGKDWVKTPGLDVQEVNLAQEYRQAKKNINVKEVPESEKLLKQLLEETKNKK